MRLSAKADYAVRAAVELAAADEGPVKGEAIAAAQGISLKFLENILSEMRHAGLVASRRGAEGGYWLARPASEITVADVMRAVEGPLATVRGERARAGRPTTARRPRCRASGSRCARTCARCSRHVTLADLAAGKLPARIEKLASEPECWLTSADPPSPAATGRSGATQTMSPLVHVERLGLAAGDLHRDAGPVGEHQLDPHLEAEVHDARDHRLERPVARLGRDAQVVRAHEPAAERRDRAEEAHHEVVGGALVELTRRADLLDAGRRA